MTLAKGMGRGNGCDGFDFGLPTGADLIAGSSLTDWEWVGLHRRNNLADGHAHYPLPARYDSIVASLPSVFAGIESTPQIERERDFLQHFFALAGQTPPSLRPILHYSSSVSIDLAAKTLRAMGVSRVGVFTPTFDNIAQLLSRAGHHLVPIDEPRPEAVVEEFLSSLGDVQALFLVLPNNPTGWTPDELWFESLVVHCEKREICLVLDFSFRFMSNLATFDQYSRLRQLRSLNWICIEDTGKTWPTAELKIGHVSCSPLLYPLMVEISGELLLNVSPLTLHFLTGLIAVDLAHGVRSVVSEVVNTNRGLLRAAFEESAHALIPMTQSRISVEWVKLRDPAAISLAKFLSERGLAVLPGGPFFWENRRRGDSFIRVALARDPDLFAPAATDLARAVDTFFNQ